MPQGKESARPGNRSHSWTLCSGLSAVLGISVVFLLARLNALYPDLETHPGKSCRADIVDAIAAIQRHYVENRSAFDSNELLRFFIRKIRGIRSHFPTQNNVLSPRMERRPLLTAGEAWTFSLRGFLAGILNSGVAGKMVVSPWSPVVKMRFPDITGEAAEVPPMRSR